MPVPRGRLHAKQGLVNEGNIYGWAVLLLTGHYTRESLSVHSLGLMSVKVFMEFLAEESK